MKNRKWLKQWLAVLCVMCVLALGIQTAQADGTFTAEATCNSGQTVTVAITMPETTDQTTQIDGYEIYRSKDDQSQYQLIYTYDINYYYADEWFDYDDEDTTEVTTEATTEDTTEATTETTTTETTTTEASATDESSAQTYSWWDDWWYDSDSGADYTYTDSEAHELYHTYYYWVRVYEYTPNYTTKTFDKTYLYETVTSVLIVDDSPVVTKAKRSGKFGLKLQWNQAANADGYLIYMVKDYDSKSNYISNDLSDESVYTLVKTINNPSVTKASFKKLKNGVTYTYRIYSYKMVNGQMVKSISSEPQSVLMDYYSCNESYEQKIKRAFGSEKKMTKNYKTSKKAAKQMTTIKIKVWDFKNGKSGKKVTKTKYLTVNKRMAPSIKAMFNEIYKSKERQVIHSIGCYSYRTGQHMYGLAIDINPTENYMIQGKKILSGKFWKPKTNAYSIPADCDLVRIMERYGFSRGIWGNRRDYMHFSYFGT